MNPHNQVQIVLVGGGIMSLTLGLMLKELDSTFDIHIYETLSDVSLESSMAWNNAGTGHQALCELNYTPRRKDGSIDISKALTINQRFELSKEFWAYCVEQEILGEPSSFIHPLPHISFVTGANVEFLKARFDALKSSPFFKNMIFTQEREKIAEFAPLLIEGRSNEEKLAATFIDGGSDVDFGAITRGLAENLKARGVSIHLEHKITDLKQNNKGWELKIYDKAQKTTKIVQANFVFLGAGGGAFQLVQKSGIREARGYAGFPINGLWLACKNKEIITKHSSKVYGKASVGDPPMSVPHLDTRMIDGKRELMFGPFASFNTRFLKYGSLLDFPLSVRPNNVLTMLQAGIDNIPLTIYLIKQVFLDKNGRMDRLRAFMPTADSKDWEIKNAGQRVQIIKKNTQGRGSLQFGTEVVVAQNGSLAAILGASPGASTSVDIILEVLERCFKKEMSSPKWHEKIQQILPSYHHTLEENIANFNTLRSRTAKILKLPFEGI